jgi:hypothetical protein
VKWSVIKMSSNQNSPQHPLRLVLNQVKIAAENIPVKELLEVEYNGEVWGPIWRNHLKAHLDAFKEMIGEIRVRDIDSEMEWVAVTEHPYFQKRIQEPLPAIPKTEVGNLFYILQGGQKVGPFTKEQILEKINAYDLVMTDPISVDMGNNWIKVYQIEEFDRRLKNENLNGSKELTNLYENLRNNNVVGLKVLQSLSKDEATNPNYNFNNTTIEPQKRREGGGDLFETKWLALFVFAVVGIVAILRSWNSAPTREKRTPASIKEERVQKMKQQRSSSTSKRSTRSSSRAPASASPAEVVKKKPANRNSAKSVASRARRRLNRPRTRTSRSISNSAALKSVRSPASDKNDYYDNGDTPDELDPVRSQVSRETMDPESEYDSEQNSKEEPYYSPTMTRKPFRRR